MTERDPIGIEIVERVRAARTLVNVICVSPLMESDIDYGEGAVVIDPEAAHYHMDRVQRLDPRTLRDLRALDGPWPELLVMVDTARDVRARHRGVRHAVGRLDMHHKLCALGVRTIVHRHPEDGLHPAAAVELGDLFIRLGKGTHP